MSLNLASFEFLISNSQEVNIYPTDPVRDGIAVMEYVVRNKAFGDLDTEKWSPFGTLKSKMASEERVKLANKLSSFQPVAL